MPNSLAILSSEELKAVHMTNANASFSPLEHSDQFRAQFEILEKLGHAQVGVANDLTEFDEETECLLRQTFGNVHEFVETCALATMAEAEALVNLPESAQESLSQDLPAKSVTATPASAPCGGGGT